LGEAAKDLLGLGVQHFDRRIDSTLKGNLGAEIDALLQALREQGTDAMAVVAAAFPGSGRSTVGGYHISCMFVHVNPSLTWQRRQMPPQQGAK